MAVDIFGSLGGLFGGIGGIVSGIGQFLPYLLLIGAIIGVFLWIRNIRSYNRKVKVWKLVGKNVMLIDELAKLHKDRAGVKHWKFKTCKKEPVDIPPDEVLGFDNKGKQVAQCYLTEDGEVIWIKHDFNIDEIRKVAKAAQEKLKVASKEAPYTPTVEEEKALKIMSTFKPITTSQRGSFVHQENINKQYAQKDLGKHLPMIIGGVFLILVFLIAAFTFGKFMQPAIDAGKSAESVVSMQLETARTLERINGNIQIIKENLDIREEYNASKTVVPP